MPRISKRGVSFPASPIRKLVPFAEKARREGKHIFNLNIGQPDIHTPAEMLEAVVNSKLKIVAYSHSAGNETYRKKLPGYYSRCGIRLTHENILVTTGGSEAILFGFLSCLDYGDEIIIPEPLYANYNGFAAAAGVVIRPVTSAIHENFALPPMQAFRKAITPKTKAILICNPNNPTGYLYSKQEVESLGQLAGEHDLFLFADEVYREFCYDGKRHFSALNLGGFEKNAVVFDSISKRYSACGARIGAIISRNPDVMDSALRLAQARLSPPAFGQIAAEASLEVPQHYFDGVREEYSSRRDLLVKGLRSIPGVVCPNPGGAFYAMAALPVDDADKFCQWLLDSFSHQDKTVLLAPGSGFYATKGLGKNEVRIAYVLKKEDLSEAIEILQLALAAYPGRKEKALVNPGSVRQR